MDTPFKTYEYACRVVSPLKDLDAVDAELDYIYNKANKPEDVVSLQVIPRFLNPQYPTLPTSFAISYVYRWEKHEDNKVKA